MPKSITVSYKIKPPADSGPVELSPQKELTFIVEPGNSSETYYESLRKGIETARTAIGDDLTAWRDAVGAVEGKKETKKTMSYGEDDEMEE